MEAHINIFAAKSCDLHAAYCTISDALCVEAAQTCLLQQCPALWGIKLI